MLMNYM